MARDIKFRAKDKETGEWRYGHYYEVPAPLVAIGKREEPKGYIVMEHPNYISDWNMPIQMCQVEIDRETLGQYIGIKDKDGTEIYEKDIVEVDNDWYMETGRVLYDKGSFLLAYCNGHEFMNDLINENSTFKVVGNAYEHPKLLEETMHKESESIMMLTILHKNTNLVDTQKIYIVKVMKWKKEKL